MCLVGLVPKMNSFIVCVLLFPVATLGVYYPDEEFNAKTGYVIYPGEDGRNHVIGLKERRVEVEVKPEDLKFYLYTKLNMYTAIEIGLSNFDGTMPDEFDGSKELYITTHGFTGSHMSSNNNNLRRLVLENYDVNVITLDWSKNAGEFYTFAKTSVPLVGKVVAEAITKLCTKYGIAYSDIKLVGHSLGAHVMGAVGANLNGEVGYIIGQDPALPLFSLNATEDRLDTTDARFVQVIHTNGGLLAFRSSIGHSDYFPNGGGMDQPGCGPDLFGGCAHGRVCRLLEESIPVSKFSSTKCDSYENFKAGLCEGNPISMLGMYEIDKSASGDYYLDTAESSPYALG